MILIFKIFLITFCITDIIQKCIERYELYSIGNYYCTHCWSFWIALLLLLIPVTIINFLAIPASVSFLMFILERIIIK
jgi:hypothetical protein